MAENPIKYCNAGYEESYTEDYDKNPFLKDSFQVICRRKRNQNALMAINRLKRLNNWSNRTIPGLDSFLNANFCDLNFPNARRFLIHHKWHSFGRVREVIKPKQTSPLKKSEKNTKPSEPQSFSCEICNQIYSSQNSLKNHKARVHFASPKECDICKKVFQNSTYLKSHLTTHTEEKKYMCDACPKTFKFLHSLLRHQPSHKEKKFACDSCDKSFGSQLLLSIHSKSHERALKGTTFQCSYCAKGFYHAYSLQVHERTHRGERPFQCAICQSSYATNSSLQRHLKVSHSGVKPFQCPVCKRSFVTESIRDRHLARLHKQEAQETNFRESSSKSPRKVPPNAAKTKEKKTKRLSLQKDTSPHMGESSSSLAPPLAHSQPHTLIHQPFTNTLQYNNINPHVSQTLLQHQLLSLQRRLPASGSDTQRIDHHQPI